MAMRRVLAIMIFQLAIAACCAVSGIIWRKQKQDFECLFNIPRFASLQKENLAKRRATETRDMSKEVVKAVFFEEKNMVMFHDNDTRIDGIHGDLWYLLADYLNFTFIPIKTISRDFGQRLENGSSDGLLGFLERNEAQVIPRSLIMTSRKDLVDYTMPVWRTRFHIYLQPEWLYDNTWVFTLFAPTTWYTIIFLFIILSFVGYFLQAIPMHFQSKRKKNPADFTLGDHFFYSFAMMCLQGYIPDDFYNNFKVLSVSKNIFAWLVTLTFNSHLIYRMTNRETTLGFTDVQTLQNHTNYKLLVFGGFFLFDFIDHKYNDGSGKYATTRTYMMNSAAEMYTKICNNIKDHAIFEIEDQYMALNRYGCLLQATGRYNESWIAFALRKNFPYKRTIDSAIIKISEVGLVDALRDRWFNVRLDNLERIPFRRIDIHQVQQIFLILCSGVVLSIVILVLENIIHYHETKGTRKHR